MLKNSAKRLIDTEDKMMLSEGKKVGREKKMEENKRYTIPVIK